MKKVIVTIVMSLLAALCLTACKSYTCCVCEKTTSKAYYDLGKTEYSVMCENCAEMYWMPFDYKDYRVK